MKPILDGAEPYTSNLGPDGVLVIHGFTGNPQSMRPLAHSLESKGFSIELPLLPGHGTSIEDMLPYRYPDWLKAAEESYLDLSNRCENIYLAALSMGGTLACTLAAKYSQIKGIVLINPFIDPPAKEYREIVEGLLESGMEIAPAVGSDIAKPDIKELAYDGSPLQGALSLFEGLDELQSLLPLINSPILLFSSREDHVVPTSSGDVLVEKVGGQIKRVWLEKSYHVATLDYDKELIEEMSVEFFMSIRDSNQ